MQLPPYQLEQLTPVLGSLARLLARGLNPGESEFRTLLFGAGLPAQPELLAELTCWVDLLGSVRERSSELALSAAAEAMILRGVPEAPAVLAVATVSDAPPRLSTPLVPPGIRAETSLGIDVTVGDPSLIVAADGSGTHATLGDAIAAVEPGATILLKKGLHTLRSGVILRHAVTIVGEGMETTDLAADQGDCVVGYEGSGLLGLCDLTLTWRGPPGRAGRVVLVRSGWVQIERCRFRGAVPSETGTGAGLEIAGNVQGAVRWCRMDTNGSGIEVGGEANLVLEHNACRGNRWSGIRYLGRSSGTARENLCTANAHDGISIQEGATPLVQANTTQGNGWSGIGCYGSAGPTLRHNFCSANDHSGIYVGERAQPLLEGNDCRENRDCGIGYFGGGGIAAANTCVGNGKYGVHVGRQARPLIEGNQCSENRDSGIAYFGSGAGIARQNQCRGNAHYGIFVGERAHPMLEGNTCEGNAWSGLAYFGNAAGTARRNTCSVNGKRGIYAGQWAHPTLQDNACEENRDPMYVAPSARRALAAASRDSRLGDR